MERQGFWNIFAYYKFIKKDNMSKKIIITPTGQIQFYPDPESLQGATGAKGDQGDQGATGADVQSGHVTIFPSCYDSIGQGVWIWGTDNNFILNGRFYNSSFADGDELSYKISLSSGVYTLHLLATKNLNCGIMKFYVDDVEIASFDRYNSSVMYNVIFRQTGITINTSGLKTLKVKCVGKNVLSTGYFISIQNISLWRTS